MLKKPQALIADKESAFWKNDKAVADQVNKAFEAAHPGEHDLSGGLGFHVEQGLAKDLNVKSESEPYPLKPPGKVIGRIGQAPEPQATPTAEPQPGTPVEFSPQWNFDQSQAEAELQKELGPYRYPEHHGGLTGPAKLHLGL